MFVNINPEPVSAYESLFSLKFAAKVNGCETGAKGGAKRNVITPSAVAGASSALTDPAGAKRLSLPGPPRAATAGSVADPAAKRMSLIGQPKPAASQMPPTTGTLKRPAASGIPAAVPPKKTKF